MGKNDNREILGIMDPEGQESPEGGEVDMEAWERHQLLPTLQRVKTRQENSWREATSKGSHWRPSPPPLPKTRQAVGTRSFWGLFKAPRALGELQGGIKAPGTVESLFPVGPEVRYAGIAPAPTPTPPPAAARCSLGPGKLWQEEVLSPPPPPA